MSSLELAEATVHKFLQIPVLNVSESSHENSYFDKVEERKLQLYWKLTTTQTFSRNLCKICLEQIFATAPLGDFSWGSYAKLLIDGFEWNWLHVSFSRTTSYHSS